MSLIKALAAATLIISLFSCETEQQKGKRLAQHHCTSCHTFPDPSLLPKTVWTKNVLPNMGFRMGLVDLMTASKFIPEDDLLIVASSLPAQPMITNAAWESIVNYFEETAPNELPETSISEIDTLKLFQVSNYVDKRNQLPMVTLIKSDTSNQKVLIGSRSGFLDILNTHFELESSIQLKSPPSHAEFNKQNELILSLMGIMDPNDQPLGEIVTREMDGQINKTLIDSLKRPVHFIKDDFNADGFDDFIICAFGNYTGGLFAYESVKDLSYTKHALSYLPGSRKVIVTDYNMDGKKDILALITQGDEQITLFENMGDFKFRTKVLVRFPPVYGSSYIELVDINKDGRLDVLYTNGDNSDLSLVFKPYHGIRIFTQNEKGDLIETWFHHMDGASQAIAYDFDNDGDLDIAAISFFSDFERSPESGFLYFENTNQTFKPYKLPQGSQGRWIVMEATDFDRDGDKDILLGALDFSGKVPPQLLERWKEDRTAVLILKNSTIK